jgi:hypothetical protein
MRNILMMARSSRITYYLCCTIFAAICLLSVVPVAFATTIAEVSEFTTKKEPIRYDDGSIAIPIVTQVIMSLHVSPVTEGSLQVTASFTLSTGCTAYDINWGDGQVQTTSPSAVASPGACSQRTMNAQHTYKKAGSYTVTLASGGAEKSTVVALGDLDASPDQQQELKNEVKRLLTIVEALKTKLLETSRNPISVMPTASSNPVQSCPMVNGRLAFGDRGNGVVALQSYLAKDASLYPEGDVTGYFGLATERAVRRFQKGHGIVSSGSAETTGYGVVGPMTREALANACGL